MKLYKLRRLANYYLNVKKQISEWEKEYEDDSWMSSDNGYFAERPSAEAIAWYEKRKDLLLDIAYRLAKEVTSPQPIETKEG